jgi:hypothetical protein
MDLFDVLALGVGFMAIPRECDPVDSMGAREDQRSDIETAWFTGSRLPSG